MTPYQSQQLKHHNFSSYSSYNTQPQKGYITNSQLRQNYPVVYTIYIFLYFLVMKNQRQYKIKKQNDSSLITQTRFGMYIVSNIQIFIFSHNCTTIKEIQTNDNTTQSIVRLVRYRRTSHVILYQSLLHLSCQTPRAKECHIFYSQKNISIFHCSWISVGSLVSCFHSIKHQANSFTMRCPQSHKFQLRCPRWTFLEAGFLQAACDLQVLHKMEIQSKIISTKTFRSWLFLSALQRSENHIFGANFLLHQLY